MENQTMINDHKHASDNFSDSQPNHIVLAVLISLVIATLSLLGPSTSKAHAATLKTNALIQGNMITLGDLFSGLKHDQERVLGPAPHPGSDMVLNARTLLRVAYAFNLNWRPKSSYEHIVLRRDASIVDDINIADIVKEKLKERGLDKGFKLSFFQAYPKIVLPGNLPATAEVKTIDYDPNRGRFSAVLAAPNLDNPIQTLELSGEIVKTSLIPVAKDTVQHGDLINKNNVEWIEIEERKIKADTVTDLSILSNMTPKRVIFAGKPISKKDIVAPRLIDRGHEVTMIYKTGGLSLTAKGKALESGSKGEIIRVVNLGSSRPIEATVTANRTVTVYN